MSEVARRGAPSLDNLAERINTEHRAFEEDKKAALGHLNAALWHALDAGDLLIQAKGAQEHGGWEDWLQANFEGSVRRAQEYMYLARSREALVPKARRTAFSSIGEALEYLRTANQLARAEGYRPESGPPVPGTTPLTPMQERAQRARERREQRLNVRAEYAIRTGNLAAPADVKAEPGEWGEAINRALSLRGQNIRNVVDALAHELDILVGVANPEAVGRYLAERPNDPDEAEARSGMLAELREGVAWLQRVLEAAEAKHGVRR